MKCQKCESERIAAVSGKTSDLCSYKYGTRSRRGYVPNGLGIDDEKSYGDYIRFSYCLKCGQIQGKFPIPESRVDQALTTRKTS